MERSEDKKKQTVVSNYLSKEENEFDMKTRMHLCRRATNTKEEGEIEEENKFIRVTSALSLVGISQGKLNKEVVKTFMSSTDDWNLPDRNFSDFVRENIIERGNIGEKEVLDQLDVWVTKSRSMLFYPKTTSSVERFKMFPFSGLPDALVLPSPHTHNGWCKQDRGLYRSIVPPNMDTLVLLEIKTPYFVDILMSDVEQDPEKRKPIHILELKKDPYYCLSHVLQTLVYARMMEEEFNMDVRPVILYNAKGVASHRLRFPQHWLHELDLEKELTKESRDELFIVFKNFIDNYVVPYKTGLEVFNHSVFSSASREHRETLRRIFRKGILPGSGGTLSFIFKTFEAEQERNKKKRKIPFLHLENQTSKESKKDWPH